MKNVNFKLKQNGTCSIYESSAAEGDLVIPKTVRRSLRSYVVTKIDDFAFAGAEKLRSVTFAPDTEVKKFGTSIFNCFEGNDPNCFYCSFFSRLVIPRSLIKLTDGWCSQTSHLTTIEIDSDHPFFAYEGGLLYSKDFKVLHFVCRHLASAIVRPEVVRIAPHACENSQLVDVRFSEQSNLTKIGRNAFNNCRIKKIEIFGPVDILCSECFDHMKQLEKVIVPNTKKLYIEQNALEESAILYVTKGALVQGPGAPPPHKLCYLDPLKDGSSSETLELSEKEKNSYLNEIKLREDAIKELNKKISKKNEEINFLKTKVSTGKGDNKNSPMKSPNLSLSCSESSNSNLNFSTSANSFSDNIDINTNKSSNNGRISLARKTKGSVSFINITNEEEDEEEIKKIKKVKQLSGGKHKRSEIWKIFRKESNENYTMKTIKVPSFSKYLKYVETYKQLNECNHPCIQKLYGSRIIKSQKNKKNKTATLYYEFQPFSIRQIISNELFMNTMKAKVLLEVCEACLYLSECGIYHGNLKVENIYLSSDFSSKIGDFLFLSNSSQKLIINSNYDGSDSNSNTLPESSTSESEEGTNSIDLPPEILRNQKIGPWTDIYSFGVLTYFVVTGGKEIKLSTTNSTNDSDATTNETKNRNTSSDEEIQQVSKFKKGNTFTDLARDVIELCVHKKKKHRTNFADLLKLMKIKKFMFFEDVDSDFVMGRFEELEMFKKMNPPTNLQV